jgi:hypothetical protein
MKIKIILAVTAVTALCAILFFSPKLKSPEISMAPDVLKFEKSISSFGAPLARQASNGSEVKTNSAETSMTEKLSGLEKESVTSNMKLLFEFSRARANPDQFFTELERQGLGPKRSRQGSDETGFMTIIRSQNPGAGTRYVHAQFMEESSTPYLQHMSFETRPGPDSMQNAIAEAKQIFDVREPPSRQTEDFVEWNRKGRTLWIKKITSDEELLNDRFNARTTDDRGVVVTAIEIDPHAHEKD